MSSKLIRRLLLVPLLLFLALELILWCFVRVPLEPLKKLDLSNDLPGLKKDVRITYDRYMTRYLDDASGPKESGKIRILCLGGSATFGLLQNAADTWWGQLGRSLQAAGLPVEVAAWGQERMGIIATMPAAATLLEDWKPDIVIGNFGFDDVVGQPLEYTYRPEKATALQPLGRTTGWKQAVLTVSQTARLFRKQARDSEAGILENRVGRPDYWKGIFEQQKKQANEIRPTAIPPRDAENDPRREFLDGWRMLSDLCSRHGAALIVTGEASLHDSTNNLTQQENLMAMVPLSGAASGEGKIRVARPEPVWVERELGRYAEAAEAFAGEARLPWLNLNSRVPRDLEHFFTDVILTDKGAAVAAAEMRVVVEPVVRAKAETGK